MLFLLSNFMVLINIMNKIDIVVNSFILIQNMESLISFYQLPWFKETRLK